MHARARDKLRMRWMPAVAGLVLLSSFAVGCGSPLGALFPWGRNWSSASSASQRTNNSSSDSSSSSSSSRNSDSSLNESDSSSSSQRRQVAKPVIGPSYRQFGGSVRVSISCSTSGATVYYTRDGTTPASVDKKYITPLIVASTTTIKARAYKSGWESSKVTSARFSKKSQPPGDGSRHGGCGTLVRECIRVRDSETNRAIAGAKATLTGNGVNRSSVTDHQGNASFDVPGCRTYTLTVSASGYTTARWDFPVAATTNGWCRPHGLHRAANSGGPMKLCLRLFADSGQVIAGAKVLVLGGGGPGAPNRISRMGFTNSQGYVTFELPHFDMIGAAAHDTRYRIGDPKGIIGVWRPPASWDKPPDYCVRWETDWMP